MNHSTRAKPELILVEPPAHFRIFPKKKDISREQKDYSLAKDIKLVRPFLLNAALVGLLIVPIIVFGGGVLPRRLGQVDFLEMAVGGTVIAFLPLFLPLVFWLERRVKAPPAVWLFHLLGILTLLSPFASAPVVVIATILFMHMVWPSVHPLVSGITGAVLWFCFIFMIFREMFSPEWIAEQNKTTLGSKENSKETEMSESNAAPSTVHPVAESLAELWEKTRRVPNPEEIQAAIQEAQTSDPGARIVCLGEPEIPNDIIQNFEPEVVPSTRSMASMRFYVVIAVALLSIWLFLQSGLLQNSLLEKVLSFLVPRSAFDFLLPWSVILIPAAIAIVIWGWFAAVRPTYIRAAPGMIQVLRYKAFSKSNPIIHSYPMDAGTLAILSAPLGKVVALTLVRREHQDKIRLDFDTETTEQLWHAFLSTAPTPPLSDEELVG